MENIGKVRYKYKDIEMKLINRLVRQTFVILLIFTPGLLFSQADSRYDSSMNLPFNSKTGDVNPQTGGISISAVDLNLPGRGGMNFSFSRIWTLNQSNMFNMYLDPIDFQNRLNSDTLDKFNGLGVGWSSNVPYIFDDISSGNLVKSLFFNGSVYEIDQAGIIVNEGTKSNFLGYDLLDKKIYRSTTVKINYGMLSNFNSLKSTYMLDSYDTSSSEYVLEMADSSKYFFDASGNLMMHEDKTGLNKIWYMYRNIYGIRRLAIVVDTIGREIRFSYDNAGNIKEVTWDVEKTVKNDNGDRELLTETRKVVYKYAPIDSTVDYNILKSQAVNYRPQYKLESVTDPGNNVTKYDYTQGKAGFTYNSTESHNDNMFLLLSSVTSNYVEDDGNEKYRNKRIIEYAIPEDKMYSKPFYNGYMEYFKVSKSYYLNRHGEIRNNTEYNYYEEGTNSNYLQYSTVITIGETLSTYIYSLSSEANKYQTLRSISIESQDGTYKKLTEFTYDAERKKTKEDVWMQGEKVYSELFQYDSKGNIEFYKDRNGVETTTEYWNKYSIPKLVSKKFYDNGEAKTYITETTIYDNETHKALIKEKKTHLSTGVISDVAYIYDNWGNIIETTDALNNKSYTVYDSQFHAFPVKEYRNVDIPSWTSGNVHDNWLTEPTATTNSTLAIYRVFNSDGSVWVEFDNAGYAVEHFYDKLGTEIETVNPDADDNTDFLSTLPAELSYNYFRENSANYNNFINSRKNNPGSRVFIDYNNDFVKTETDIDLSSGGIKKSGIQKDGLGNVEQEITYNGNDSTYSVKEMTYDSYSRLIGITDPDASESNINFKTDGHFVKYHDKTWIIKYDQMGRQRQIIYPRTSQGRDDVKTISYNDLENSVTTTDPLKRVVYEKKDWSGNTTEVKKLGTATSIEADIQTYSYSYDGLNRKVKFKDPMGLVTEYKYDERNLLIEQIYYEDVNDLSLYGSDKMYYDNLGRMIYKTDRKKQVLGFEYDSVGRNISTKHYEPLENYNNDFASLIQEIELASPVREIKNVFDERGNIVRVSSESLIEHYKYDYANRIETLDRYIKDESIRNGIKEVSDIPALNNALSFSYKYNDAGMVTSMTYPDNSVHTFSYNDSLGFLTGIDQGDNVSQTPFINSLEYNKAGVVTKMNYANNTYQTWSFDNRKRISNITVVGKDSNDLLNLNYVLNGVGDVVSINDEYSYGYDDFGRISNAKTLLPGNVDKLKLVKDHFGTYQDESGYSSSADIFPIGTPDGVINGEDHIQATLEDINSNYDIEDFTYDVNGNRLTLTQNGDTYRYTYGKRNRLTSIHLKEKGSSLEEIYAEYDYDANGNTKKRTLYNSSGIAIITDFTYDTLNRLVTTTENGRVVTYKYDNAGNRFIKITPDKTTVYLRHGQIAVAMDIDINSDKTEVIGEINRYVLSGDLTSGRIKTVKNADTTTDVSLSFYNLDHLNSTKMVTDSNGVIEVNYIYRAFGDQLKKLNSTGEETTDKAKYSYGGKELDDTNLYYFNQRYYDATIGRFINVDPIQDGTNWYIYCSNNPLNMIDPTGLRQIEGATVTNDMEYEPETDSMVDMVTVKAEGTEKFLSGGVAGGSTSLDGSAGEDGLMLGTGSCDVNFSVVGESQSYDASYKTTLTKFAGINFGVETTKTEFEASVRMPKYKALNEEYVKDSWKGPFNSLNINIPTPLEPFSFVVTEFWGNSPELRDKNWRGNSFGGSISIGKSIPVSASVVDYQLEK